MEYIYFEQSYFGETYAEHGITDKNLIIYSTLLIILVISPDNV